MDVATEREQRRAGATRSAQRSACSAVTRLQRVFIDTSESFPFTIMDVLLTLSGDFLVNWVWTDHLLEEWTEA